ncbi:MAG: LEA type 2 family protein [Steroidobacter sp.]
MKRIAMILGCLLLISGCTITSDFKPPRLSIMNVGMVSADVFSQQFRVRLHVENPNNVELPIKSIEYTLYLQGDEFAEGTSAQPFVVPAHGETEFDTMVDTNFVSSIVRMLGTLNDSTDNKVQYNFTGKIRLSKGMINKIPFNETGVVDLKNFRK